MYHPETYIAALSAKFDAGCVGKGVQSHPASLVRTRSRRGRCVLSLFSFFARPNDARIFVMHAINQMHKKENREKKEEGKESEKTVAEPSRGVPTHLLCDAED